MGAKRKNPNAVALGRKGGKARAQKLSAEELSAIGKEGGHARFKGTTAADRKQLARKAIATRWAKTKEKEQT